MKTISCPYCNVDLRIKDRGIGVLENPDGLVDMVAIQVMSHRCQVLAKQRRTLREAREIVHQEAATTARSAAPRHGTGETKGGDC